MALFLPERAEVGSVFHEVLYQAHFLGSNFVREMSARVAFSDLFYVSGSLEHTQLQACQAQIQGKELNPQYGC